MKFSIITCTYNSEAYLQKNIDSVKNQAFQDFEHIFIDGFSTDKTIEMIKKYQQEFPDKVKLFQFEPKGIAHAMNKGIGVSSGDYINHLHSDDSFFNNDILQTLSDCINFHADIDWFYGKANFINAEKSASRIIPHRKIYRKIRYWLLLLTNYIPHQSVFIKKAVFNKFGTFDENLKNIMDYDMWIRLSKNKVPAKFIDKIICNFSVRKYSQSAIGNNENIIVYRKVLKSKLLLRTLRLIDEINKKRNFI